jgi:hypothetical protein
LAGVATVGDRYRSVLYGGHELRLLLAKNPAGWSEMLRLLEPAAARVFVVNAREADGRDTSGLWDVVRAARRAGHERGGRRGEGRRSRAAAGLDYARVEHVTVADPLAALATVPAGKVEVVATYTAFHALTRGLQTDTARAA